MEIARERWFPDFAERASGPVSCGGICSAVLRWPASADGADRFLPAE